MTNRHPNPIMRGLEQEMSLANDALYGLGIAVRFSMAALIACGIVAGGFFSLGIMAALASYMVPSAATMILSAFSSLTNTFAFPLLGMTIVGASNKFLGGKLGYIGHFFGFAGGALLQYGLLGLFPNSSGGEIFDKLIFSNLLYGGVITTGLPILIGVLATIALGCFWWLNNRQRHYNNGKTVLGS